jgi:methyl-accepting chemotaxis protein
MNFKNMTVARRLAVAFGVVLLVSVIAAILSISKLSAMEENLREIVLVNNVKSELNNDMMDASHVVSRVMRSVVLLDNKADKERENAKIIKAREDYDKAWEALQKFPASEEGKVLRAKITAGRDLARPLNNKVIELGLNDKTAEAIALLFKEANPATIKWQEAMEENITLQKATSEKEFKSTESAYQQARLLLILANLINAGAAIVLGWLVTRSITSQLGGEPAQAAQIAQAVAQGDLTVPISLQPGDSTSMMAQLKKMQESLALVVGRVRSGSDAVSNASAEISQGNNDLSARTEEQASSLEQTAASMEQLAATVKHNADSALQANQLALNASTVAVRGGEVVGQVVETMRGINDSSRKIADIISVIDGIAFQTNILALNAAVEAARAGEQGRGFAVVASEVRSLAGRSAEAAKEIKTLIGTSVERVEFGSNLVDQAGATMSEVVSAIRRVTDLMGEISAASKEQSAGVSQVGEAVVQMDQVTQQNAALVEEMAAAASSLKSRAEELVQTVSIFKLSQQHEVVSLHVAPRVSAPRPAPARPQSLAKPQPKPHAQAPKLVHKVESAGSEEAGWDSF